MLCMNKIKQGKRDRDTEVESDGVVGTILYRVSRESMTNKVTFEQRTEGNEGISHVDMWERSVLS